MEVTKYRKKEQDGILAVQALNNKASVTKILRIITPSLEDHVIDWMAEEVARKKNGMRLPIGGEIVTVLYGDYILCDQEGTVSQMGKELFEQYYCREEENIDADDTAVSIGATVRFTDNSPVVELVGNKGTVMSLKQGYYHITVPSYRYGDVFVKEEDFPACAETCLDPDTSFSESDRVEFLNGVCSINPFYLCGKASKGATGTIIKIAEDCVIVSLDDSPNAWVYIPEVFADKVLVKRSRSF